MLDKQFDIARKIYLLSDSFLVATRLLKDAGLGIYWLFSRQNHKNKPLLY